MYVCMYHKIIMTYTDYLSQSSQTKEKKKRRWSEFIWTRVKSRQLAYASADAGFLGWKLWR